MKIIKKSWLKFLKDEKDKNIFENGIDEGKGFTGDRVLKKYLIDFIVIGLIPLANTQV